MRLIKKPGNNIRLYKDDCLEIMKQIPSESIDCVITDCPYHIISGGCSTGAYGNGLTYRQCGGVLQKTDKPTIGCGRCAKKWETAGQLNENYQNVKAGKLFQHNDIKFQDWLPYVYRILKDDTHCYIMINPRNLSELQQEAEKVGFAFQQLLIWEKGNATPNRYYLNAFECILMLRKGKARNINNMGTKNILKIPNIIGNKKHPTEKPVELLRILVENSTQVGDTVIDPFMGAGATGLACKDTGRKFIGCEIDEKYFNIAKERIYNESNIQNRL